MRNRPAVKAACVTLIASFVLESGAFADPGILSAAIAAPVRTPSIPRLPESIARVEEILPGNNGISIFFIQDAHTNDSAQTHIAQLLETLEKEGVHTVFLEAGTGDDSLHQYRSLASPRVRREVGRSFVLGGEMSGAEYHDLTTDGPSRLWGVEDPALYTRSIEAYRQTAKNREAYRAALDKAARAIDSLKTDTYSPMLMDWDRVRQARLRDADGPVSYFNALCRLAEKSGAELKYYPDLFELQNVIELEKSVRFDAASREQARALEALTKEEREELLREVQAPHKAASQDLARADAFLSDLAEKNNDFSGMPELSRYRRYVEAARRLHSARVLSQMELLENEIARKLIRTAAEKELIRAEDYTNLLKRLVNLTMTPEDYERYLREKKAGGVAELFGRINRRIDDQGRDYGRALFLDENFESLLGQAESFYELTLERDRAFVRNMLADMKKTGEKKAALLAGGYHAPSLKRLLAREGVAYVSILPQMTKETNLKRYEKILFERARASSAPASQADQMAGKVFAEIPELGKDLGARLSRSRMSRRAAVAVIGLGHQALVAQQPKQNPAQRVVNVPFQGGRFQFSAATRSHNGVAIMAPAQPMKGLVEIEFSGTAANRLQTELAGVLYRMGDMPIAVGPVYEMGKDGVLRFYLPSEIPIGLISVGLQASLMERGSADVAIKSIRFRPDAPASPALRAVPNSLQFRQTARNVTPTNQVLSYAVVPTPLTPGEHLALDFTGDVEAIRGKTLTVRVNGTFQNPDRPGIGIAAMQFISQAEITPDGYARVVVPGSAEQEAALAYRVNVTNVVVLTPQGDETSRTAQINLRSLRIVTPATPRPQQKQKTAPKGTLKAKTPSAQGARLAGRNSIVPVAIVAAMSPAAMQAQNAAWPFGNIQQVIVQPPVSTPNGYRIIVGKTMAQLEVPGRGIHMRFDYASRTIVNFLAPQQGPVPANPDDNYSMQWQQWIAQGRTDWPSTTSTNHQALEFLSAQLASSGVAPAPLPTPATAPGVGPNDFKLTVNVSDDARLPRNIDLSRAGDKVLWSLKTGFPAPDDKINYEADLKEGVIRASGYNWPGGIHVIQPSHDIFFELMTTIIHDLRKASPQTPQIKNTLDELVALRDRTTATNFTLRIKDREFITRYENRPGEHQLIRTTSVAIDANHNRLTQRSLNMQTGVITITVSDGSAAPITILPGSAGYAAFLEEYYLAPLRVFAVDDVRAARALHEANTVFLTSRPGAEYLQESRGNVAVYLRERQATRFPFTSGGSGSGMGLALTPPVKDVIVLRDLANGNKPIGAVQAGSDYYGADIEAVQFTPDGKYVSVRYSERSGYGVIQSVLIIDAATGRAVIDIGKMFNLAAIRNVVLANDRVTIQHDSYPSNSNQPVLVTETFAFGAVNGLIVAEVHAGELRAKPVVYSKKFIGSQSSGGANRLEEFLGFVDESGTARNILVFNGYAGSIDAASAVSHLVPEETRVVHQSRILYAKIRRQYYGIGGPTVEGNNLIVIDTRNGQVVLDAEQTIQAPVHIDHYNVGPDWATITFRRVISDSVHYTHRLGASETRTFRWNLETAAASQNTLSAKIVNPKGARPELHLVRADEAGLAFNSIALTPLPRAKQEVRAPASYAETRWTPKKGVNIVGARLAETDLGKLMVEAALDTDFDGQLTNAEKERVIRFAVQALIASPNDRDKLIPYFSSAGIGIVEPQREGEMWIFIIRQPGGRTLTVPLGTSDLRKYLQNNPATAVLQSMPAAASRKEKARELFAFFKLQMLHMKSALQARAGEPGLDAFEIDLGPLAHIGDEARFEAHVAMKAVLAHAAAKANNRTGPTSMNVYLTDPAHALSARQQNLVQGILRDLGNTDVTFAGQVPGDKRFVARALGEKALKNLGRDDRSIYLSIGNPEEDSLENTIWLLQYGVIVGRTLAPSVYGKGKVDYDDILAHRTGPIHESRLLEAYNERISGEDKIGDIQTYVGLLTGNTDFLMKYMLKLADLVKVDVDAMVAGARLVARTIGVAA